MARGRNSWRWPLKALPQVVVAGRFPLEDRGFGYQYRSPTHALHLYGYHGEIRIGAEQFALRPGDVTITAAHRASTYDLPAPGYHWCIHFNAVAPRGEITELPIHFALASMQEFAASRVREIARLHAQASSLSLAAASAALQELLLWLAMQAQARTSEARERRSISAVERAAAIVHAQFTEPLSVPELADEVGMTQNYLARMFRRRFGVTIPRYLLHRRIDYARHLLMTTNIPIHRVAQRVGLPDAQHFNKQFRKLVGTSPSQARIDFRK
ncbi:MAG TPA: AraC family transcriptional regulator [Tepidisphaeraceae bacterium]|nr:AraC family transcriptional regulator [Tepidisphaeraceae bacterium]